MNKLNFYECMIMDIFLHTPKNATVVRALGEDAEDYLQSQLTINLKNLNPGEIRYGMRLSLKGRVLAGAYVMRFGSENFVLLSRGTESKVLIELLEENVIADEVEFSDESADWKWQTVWGEGLTERLGFSLPANRELKKVGDGFAFLESRLPEGVVSILSPRDEVSQALGLSEELRQVDQGELEHLRIRAGLVAIPQEIGPGELPQEGGLEENFVDFDKGCYLGQEVMARLHAMGKARRRAVPVYWTEREPPPIPTALLNGEKEVGSLKSMFMREEGELEWQSFMKMEFLNWMKTVCLSATRKGEESKGCERRRIHQTSGEGFSKHGSRTRGCPENGKSTGQACRTKGKREQKLENHRITAVVGTFRLRSPRTAQTRRKGRFGRKITPKPRKNGVFVKKSLTESPKMQS